MRRTSLWLALVASFALTAGAAEDLKPSADEQAIRQNVKAYVEAYNRRDAQAVAAMWAEDAVYVNRSTGQQFVGPKEIQSDLEAQFAQNKDSKLRIDVESIRMLSPSVGIERGVAQVTGKDQPATTLEYSAVHVKRAGKWLLDRVTEEELLPPPAAVEKLKQLEWLVGDWNNADKNGGAVQVHCEWAKNQTFLVRSFSIDFPDQAELSGVQIIGWDAAANKIRSWVFDTDGGFGEGTWSKQGDTWTIQQAGTLADGRRSSTVTSVKIVDADNFLWRVTGREVDGEILPNLPEVKVQRAK